MKQGFFLKLFILSASFSCCFGENPDYWNAEEYYKNSSSQKQAASDLMKQVVLRESDVILDVGCGDGKISAEIASKVEKGRVVGVDISNTMIDFARLTYPESDFPNLKFFVEDAQRLDFENQFDIVFSFTALQWVENQDAFLEGAYRALKNEGIVAVTMPMGLPLSLEQAVEELICKPEWSSYFTDFTTGWNFVSEVQYEKHLRDNQFTPIRVAVLPQKDIFPSRDVFEKFIGQWFPYLRPLPQDLKSVFLTRVVDRFLELEPPSSEGEVFFKVRRLEATAKKEL